MDTRTYGFLYGSFFKLISTSLVLWWNIVVYILEDSFVLFKPQFDHLGEVLLNFGPNRKAGGTHVQELEGTVCQKVDIPMASVYKASQICISFWKDCQKSGLGFSRFQIGVVWNLTSTIKSIQLISLIFKTYNPIYIRYKSQDKKEINSPISSNDQWTQEMKVKKNLPFSNVKIDKNKKKTCSHSSLSSFSFLLFFFFFLWF